MSTSKGILTPLTAALIAVALMGCDGNEPTMTLGELLEGLPPTMFHAVYDLEVTEDGSTSELVLTMAMKGEIASSLQLESERLAVSVVKDEENAYICANRFALPRADGSTDPVCFGGSVEDDPDGEGLLLLAAIILESLDEIEGQTSVWDPNDDEAAVEREGTESIAARDAVCYEVSGPETDARLCVDEHTGMPLLWNGTVDGYELLLQAKYFSDTVDETAFEPPYEVKEISDVFAEQDLQKRIEQLQELSE